MLATSPSCSPAIPHWSSRRLTFLFAVGVCLVGCHSTRERGVGAYPYDLAGFHRPVTTQSAKAQEWFDRGLAHCYGFNHEEAIRCFEMAALEDPECAMVFWGIAYALGPNYNNLDMDEVKTRLAHEHARRAAALAHTASPVERALIEALQPRYEFPPPTDRGPLERRYANAMRHVHEQHPDDPDVAALRAEAVMNLRPWKLWSPSGEPAPETPEIVQVLDHALARWPAHPGLCHFQIHTLEASPHPERALAAADQLRAHAPALGHLVHMPSHIDIRLGRYAAAIEANQRAIELDREYVRRMGAENFYTLYRGHNYHFLVYAAMFEGQSRLAMDAARELVQQIPPVLLAEMPDYLEGFLAVPWHVMVRFGRWDEVLAEPAPPADQFGPRAFWHYARGIAYAATGRVAAAQEELIAFRAAQQAVPETRVLFNNSVASILEIAARMLEGELEFRRGRHEEAFVLLRAAVELDDALNYDEPWGWMQPARHALGALLLERSRLEEAEQEFRKDLVRHPENVWALHGLAEATRRLGRPDAAEWQGRLERASSRADAVIQAACYCRPGTSG